MRCRQRRVIDDRRRCALSLPAGPVGANCALRGGDRVLGPPDTPGRIVNRLDDESSLDGGHGAAEVQPGLELCEASVIHTDFAAAAACAAADEDRTSPAI